MVESIKKKTYYRFRALDLEGVCNIVRKRGLQKIHKNVNRRFSKTIKSSADDQAKVELKNYFSGNVKDQNERLNCNLSVWK